MSKITIDVTELAVCAGADISKDYKDRVIYTFDYFELEKFAEFAIGEALEKNQQEQVCPTCGSDCNERDELIKAEREIEKLRESLTDDDIEDLWESITGHSIFGGDRKEGRAMYISPDEVFGFYAAIKAAHGIKP